MCGISGIYNFLSSAPVEQHDVRAMMDSIAHRGPDDAGSFVEGGIGLGHRRLSILDLSKSGHQPMHSDSGRFVFIFNGEIYNFLELRQGFASGAYPFKTATDTEVVLALFEKYGSDSLRKLNGMFALAVWDTQKRELFLARDRLGIKPLYYSETADGFVFASEIKALFASGKIQPEVESRQIDTYMTFGYVPGESTLFKGIKKLPPGFSMTVNVTGIQTSQYWDVDFSPNMHRSMQETKHELYELIEDAMRIHMRSDVPVGVFLSGGLDSSVTVAMLARAGHKQLNTFSVAYEQGGFFDETPYAKLVAETFGTRHHELYLSPKDFVGFIPDYVWYMDEPVTEAAAISLYFVSKMLRQHVTVALSGEGADELFAGYDIYRYMQLLEQYRKAPALIRKTLGFFLGGLRNEKINKYLRLADLPLSQRYLGVSLHEIWYKKLLYNEAFKESLNGQTGIEPLVEFYKNTDGFDILSKMLYVDLKTWLVDDLLIKADKMTMANSVELRVPFLDYRVVEYAASIPSSMKRKGGDVKWILKQTVKDILPEQIIRRKKVGFPTPLAMMFQTDLKDYMHDILLGSSSYNRNFFKPEAVKQLIDEHVGKKKDHHKTLWQLIVLEEWKRRFVGGGVEKSYLKPQAV